jgi:hypothetical protein
MKHLINRQTIHIVLSKGSDGFRMQQQMSGHYWKDIVPVMASVFDELSNNEDTIRIDRLEIDLGVLSEREINQSSWEGVILEAIRKQLHEKIGERQRSPWVIREPKVISTCRQWLFYMQKGYLPWNAIEVGDAWYKVVLETLAVDYASVSELRRMIKFDPVVSHRIVAQHKGDFLVKLIEILTAQRHQELPGIVEVLHNMLLQINSSGFRVNEIMKGTQTIWLLLIREVAESEKQLSSQSLVERILRRHWSVNSNFHFPDKENVMVRDIILPVVDQLRKEAGLTPADKDMVAHEKVLMADQEKETKKIERIDQGIYLQNAGVVLLHPFLPSLFKRLQIVKEGRFASIQAQQKALYIIHYMATGLMEAEEYELPVAKVLCAWPLDKPVEKNIELSPDELNETGNMIGAAIEQWSVLKNTSVAGMREGFLQRNGKLFTENDKLYLRVEAQAIDALLDQLPWVLSMIKLPWMMELLRV